MCDICYEIKSSTTDATFGWVRLLLESLVLLSVTVLYVPFHCNDPFIYLFNILTY